MKRWVLLVVIFCSSWLYAAQVPVQDPAPVLPPDPIDARGIDERLTPIYEKILPWSSGAEVLCGLTDMHDPYIVGLPETTLRVALERDPDIKNALCKILRVFLQQPRAPRQMLLPLCEALEVALINYLAKKITLGGNQRMARIVRRIIGYAIADFINQWIVPPPPPDLIHIPVEPDTAYQHGYGMQPQPQAVAVAVRLRERSSGMLLYMGAAELMAWYARSYVHMLPANTIAKN